jgi:hypothetical protein
VAYPTGLVDDVFLHASAQQIVQHPSLTSRCYTDQRESFPPAHYRIGRACGLWLQNSQW